MKPLLSATNLCKTYQMGEVQVNALRGIDFEISRGEFIVILGPSGSGKTTFLNLVGGMDKATAGELYYKDTPLHNADSKQLTSYRRHKVGFIFQFFNLIPNLNAFENVQLASQIADAPLSAREMLVKVGLGERITHFPSQLSGGEQQRVAIARALVKNPEILLCDEPTGSLDFETSIQVLRLLVQFSKDLEKTVVLITHNSAIAETADRVFHLKDGKLVRIKRNAEPLPPEKVVW